MSSSRQSHYDTSSQQTDGAADSSASKRKRGPPIKFSMNEQATRKRLKGRESATRLRAAKATRTRDLETQITQLESTTDATNAENAELRSLIESLRSEISSVQKEVDGEMVEDDEMTGVIEE